MIKMKKITKKRILRNCYVWGPFFRGSEFMSRRVYCKGCGEPLGWFDADKKCVCKKCGGENRYSHARGSIVFIHRKTLSRNTASGMMFG